MNPCYRSEVKPDDGKCERSQLTGEMKITLPKLFVNPKYELVSVNTRGPIKGRSAEKQNDRSF